MTILGLSLLLNDFDGESESESELMVFFALSRQMDYFRSRALCPSDEFTFRFQPRGGVFMVNKLFGPLAAN